MPEVAPVLMVEIDVPGVERDLRAGLLCCPSCAGALAPWGWARRRCVRSLERGALLALRPRRARCRVVGARMCCCRMRVFCAVSTRRR